MHETIPDFDLFMICERVDRSAFRPLPSGLSIRNCREDELAIWKAFPFDDPVSAAQHASYMDTFFENVYAGQREEFFRRCLFVCDAEDKPLGTCFIWKAYGKVNTLHWFKVLKPYEGRGIGRALLTALLEPLQDVDYPVYLHTQPASYRAIKLYTDFGFSLLTNPFCGSRPNGLEQSLPILKAYMPRRDFDRLRTASAPQSFVELVSAHSVAEF